MMFTETDLIRPVKELLPPKETSLGTFGLTRSKYLEYEYADFCQDRTCNDKKTLGQCHMYNLVHMECEEPLSVVLDAYGWAGVKEGSLDKFLEATDNKIMFRIGWTFWSIPLGTFAKRISDRDQQ